MLLGPLLVDGCTLGNKLGRGEGKLLGRPLGCRLSDGIKLGAKDGSLLLVGELLPVGK